MAYEMQGKIISVGDKLTMGASGFVKREFVLDASSEKYKNEIKFELHKERADLIDRRHVGELARVTFDIRGSEWNGRHYVNLVAYGVVCDECAPVEPGAVEDYGGGVGEPVADVGPGLF